MSDSGELLRKADALLGRYRGGPREEPDSDYPVLTEVVDRAERDARPAQADPAPARRIGSLGEPAALEWQSRLLQQVQDRLHTRLQAALEASLQERVDTHIGSALLAIAEQLRGELDSMVQAAVADAIAEAVRELQEGGSPPE